jgi:hypothetical protein
MTINKNQEMCFNMICIKNKRLVISKVDTKWVNAYISNNSFTQKRKTTKKLF